jgi:hypothetical protein
MPLFGKKISKIRRKPLHTISSKFVILSSCSTRLHTQKLILARYCLHAFACVKSTRKYTFSKPTKSVSIGYLRLTINPYKRTHFTKNLIKVFVSFQLCSSIWFLCETQKTQWLLWSNCMKDWNFSHITLERYSSLSLAPNVTKFEV